MPQVPTRSRDGCVASFACSDYYLSLFWSYVFLFIFVFACLPVAAPNGSDSSFAEAEVGHPAQGPGEDGRLAQDPGRGDARQAPGVGNADGHLVQVQEEVDQRVRELDGAGHQAQELDEDARQVPAPGVVGQQVQALGVPGVYRQVQGPLMVRRNAMRDSLFETFTKRGRKV